MNNYKNEMIKKHGKKSVQNLPMSFKSLMKSIKYQTTREHIQNICNDPKIDIV